MEDEEFRGLVGVLGVEQDVGRVVAELARRRPEEILGFHERLRLAVAALDTAEHRRQPVADVSGGRPAVPSDDAFEDLRVAVVALGRDRWRAAVADPGALAGVWSLELGEHLGQAAAEAYELATGDRWPNLDLATPYDPGKAGLPPTSLHTWLSVIPFEPEEVPLPEAYRTAWSGSGSRCRR